MSGFDFVFALFSLVLGLAVAEVLGGFATVMKLHARARAGKARDVRVGWLVPLLAVLVTLNQLSFWMFAYGVRETLPFSYLTLLAVLTVVGAYYLFSSLVFPDDPQDWPDFDLWYDQNNRFILVGMLAINLAIHLATAALRSAPTEAMARLTAGNGGLVLTLTAMVLAEWLALLLLVFLKGRRTNAILLAACSLLTVAQAAIVAGSGLGAIAG